MWEQEGQKIRKTTRTNTFLTKNFINTWCWYWFQILWLLHNWIKKAANALQKKTRIVIKTELSFKGEETFFVTKNLISLRNDCEVFLNLKKEQKNNNWSKLKIMQKVSLKCLDIQTHANSATKTYYYKVFFEDVYIRSN